jgi:hypothetical protein
MIATTFREARNVNWDNNDDCNASDVHLEIAPIADEQACERHFKNLNMALESTFYRWKHGENRHDTAEEGDERHQSVSICYLRTRKTV